MDRVDALEKIVPSTMNLPEMAIRFILSNNDVHTTIPGMRQVRHVKRNIRASDGAGLPASLLEELQGHRWDRMPTEWSY
jgi:aryl-alcohol dehydrogenase-like predicted oxidoreductase